MSTYEHHADIENARQIQQADHESRTHEWRLFPRNDGPTRRYRPSCALCGPIGDWHTDAEDARTLGRRHTASMAADVTAGVCTCNPAEVERGACILCSKPFPVGGSV